MHSFRHIPDTRTLRVHNAFEPLVTVEIEAGGTT
jgi:hypothetical protein